jgi:hypothetical protein
MQEHGESRFFPLKLQDGGDPVHDCVQLFPGGRDIKHITPLTHEMRPLPENGIPAFIKLIERLVSHAGLLSGRFNLPVRVTDPCFLFVLCRRSAA